MPDDEMRMGKFSPLQPSCPKVWSPRLSSFPSGPLAANNHLTKHEMTISPTTNPISIPVKVQRRLPETFGKGPLGTPL